MLSSRWNTALFYPIKKHQWMAPWLVNNRQNLHVQKNQGAGLFLLLYVNKYNIAKWNCKQRSNSDDCTDLFSHYQDDPIAA